jgi:cell migration-inducing and hyaluronan-binding protein
MMRETRTRQPQQVTGAVMSDANARYQGNAIGRFAATNLKQWLLSKTKRLGSPASVGIEHVQLVAALFFGWLLILGTSTVANAATCASGSLLAQPLLTTGEPQPDLLVTDGECRVPPGDYYYGNVNIIHNGRLIFEEQGSKKTNFWASSIVVEAGGYLYAGAYNNDEPFGTSGGVLTIYLYGKDQSNGDPVGNPGQGVLCRSEENDFYGPCGIPKRLWDDNGKTFGGLVFGMDDYFYQYGPLHGDSKCSDGSKWTDGKCGTAGGKAGYFGYKTLAVSYGGGVFLRGYKGAIYDKDPSLLINHPEASVDADHLSSGTSWMRLADGHSLQKDAASLTLERDPAGTWGANDEIVVTTTDYLPRHSEKLKIDAGYSGGTTVGFQAVESPTGKIEWPHNGTRYGGPSDDPMKQWKSRLEGRIRNNLDPDLVKNGADTRAAVALLTRSIRIVSAGDKAGQTFEEASKDPNNCQKTKAAPDNCYSFGATTVVRQGFSLFRMQGVEFKQMGQGGRLGHYPVHFHMARQTPVSTYVKDSSVNESMTRWFVIHSTLGVTLARNVGYKSIGHGYYLEDGTETDNNFYSNIGIFARAAVASVDPATGSDLPNPQNPRMIPGILADNQDPTNPKFASPNVANPGFPYRSDNEYPSVFWITNGWNDFQGNMAAGAGTCGAAYWLVPAANMNMLEVHNGPETKQKWLGYAALQGKKGYGGTTPLKSFSNNYATSTMHSFQTTDDAPPCDGVIAADATKPDNFRVLRAIKSLAPEPTRHEVEDPKTKVKHSEPDPDNDDYYPHVLGGARKATECPRVGNAYDCSTVPVCAQGSDPSKDPMKQCAVTVLDHYTSSFHWAHGNVSAIWLRPQWYLLTNSVISDVQNGGLSFVSGGDYTHSSMIGGYWALARSTIFIGNTNNNSDSTKNNPYASNAGPFNPLTEPRCELIKDKGAPGYCLNSAEGISMPTSGFFTNQRLTNIYDGPTYQDSNAYLDITTTDCPSLGVEARCMYGMGPPFLLLKREPSNPDPKKCYLPNAAIGWKQPNGFFYPPAFHSKNLFFDNVELRHYVIAPLFNENTYLTNIAQAQDQYCTGSTTFFDDWTSIDRQTELNDDDGSLTGLTNSLPDGPLQQTISINEDAFFSAPVETAECGSAVGANADAASACKTPDAKKPPVTARTSPYDYVATVVYHTSVDQAADPWGIDCANKACYGVPLYRQYLTDTTDGKDRSKSTQEMKRWYDNKCDQQTVDGPIAACRWPFIRMAGSSISQRETLTINNGVYYLDTTVSEKTQRTEKYANTLANSVNVFTAGQTYYVFFVYAKQSTVQSYQIYVGKNFDKAKQFNLINANIDTGDLKFLPGQNAVKWANPEYDPASGILTVQVNFKGLTTLDPTPANGLCMPRTFCKPNDDPNGNSCVAAFAPDNSLYKVANEVCGNWAVKDLDCPPAIVERKDNNDVWISGGCPGFSFTLPSSPSDFSADDKYHRPKPQPFPLDNSNQGQPWWTTKFMRTLTLPDKTGGRCNYKDPLPDRNCPASK